MKIKVDQFVGYRKVKAPNELDSGGLGPCIAVGAIYGDNGYLVHETSADEYTDHLDKLLKDLKADVTDSTNLKIFVAGGSPQPSLTPKENKAVRRSRKIVIDKIRKAGFGQNIVITKWGTPYIALGMSLNLTAREPRFDETSF